MLDLFDKISVITPVHNAEKFIGETIESMLAQEFRDFEWILVDDCSKDRSVEIIEGSRKFFPDGQLRIFLREENSGIASIPRNLAMKHARGKYITFLDHDDLLMKNSLAELYRIAEANQADIVSTRKYHAYDGRRDSDGNLLTGELSFEASRGREKQSIEFLNPSLHERIELFRNFEISWNIWGKLFRRDFLESNQIIEFESIPFVDDLIFVFKCICQAKQYIELNDSLYIYRLHPDATTHKIFDRDFFERVLKSNMIGLKLLESFMSSIPHFESFPKDRESILDFFFDLQMKGTAFTQFTLTKDRRAEYDSALNEIFVPIFGNQSKFVKQLFKTANLIQVKNLQALLQAPQTQTRLERKSIN